MSAVAGQRQIIKGGSFLIEERAPEEIFTPEDFTEEHRMIADTTRQFVDKEVTPRIDELEKHDWKLARELVSKAAELGLIAYFTLRLTRPLISSHSESTTREFPSTSTRGAAPKTSGSAPTRWRKVATSKSSAAAVRSA